MQTVELGKIAPVLRDGYVVVVSTPVSYALICDARNDDAVNKLRTLKKLDPEKGFRILIESDARLNRHVADVPSLAWDIIDTAEEPMVLILPGGRQLSKFALAADGSIAVQIVKDPQAFKLIQMANCPLIITGLDGTSDSYNFSSADYMINLPATFLQTSQSKKIPIIYLGSNNEVQVIRE